LYTYYIIKLNKSREVVAIAADDEVQNTNSERKGVGKSTDDNTVTLPTPPPLKTLEDISCIIESPKRNRRYTRPRT
jgi:hypothetical protein